MKGIVETNRLRLRRKTRVRSVLKEGRRVQINLRGRESKVRGTYRGG